MSNFVALRDRLDRLEVTISRCLADAQDCVDLARDEEMGEAILEPLLTMRGCLVDALTYRRDADAAFVEEVHRV